MPSSRFAYMPLITYPDAASDSSVEAAAELAKVIGAELHATTFVVEIPRASTSIGGLLLNMPEMIRITVENSKARCRQFEALLTEKAGAHAKVQCSTRQSQPALTADTAASESRYFDVVLLPWSKGSPAVGDFAQAVVFGSGRPSILVPPGITSEPVKNVAIAWDASRVAARALADLMPLLADDCQITVLTVEDEKPLPDNGIAEALASSLRKRGYRAEAQTVALHGRKIAQALQEAALNSGVQILAMGGFGHSRVRDFVLGGATMGVFDDLRLPVLLSH